MRQLPQQMLDNLSPKEWLDYQINNEVFPPSVEEGLNDLIEQRAAHYECELQDQYEEDFIEEYDRGFDAGILYARTSDEGTY